MANRGRWRLWLLAKVLPLVSSVIYLYLLRKESPDEVDTEFHSLPLPSHQSLSNDKTVPDQTDFQRFYDAALDPIAPYYKPGISKPVKVRILLFDHASRSIRFRDGPNWAISDEVLNICMDGFSRSSHFELVGSTIVPDLETDPQFALPDDHNMTWIVDMRRTILRHGHTITRQLVHLVNNTLSLNPQASLRVVLMDYRDKFAAHTVCTKAAQELIQVLGVGNVRSVLRRVTVGRHWDEKTNFVKGSRWWKGHHDRKCFGSATLRTVYTVRSDYASSIESNYKTRLSYGSKSSCPADTVRNVDVAHFWDVKNNSESYSNLRDQVTLMLRSLHNYTILADFVSTAASGGRVGLSSNYTDALLSVKIVVVAQRDAWEDHYRLFEAIIGGALVFTDPMISLPYGLVHKENIIVYKSLDELKELLGYYLHPARAGERLSIARRGYELATTQYRTYHWMEYLFFGKRLTTTALG